MDLRVGALLCCVLALATALPQSLFEDGLFLGENQQQTSTSEATSSTDGHFRLADVNATDGFLILNETDSSNNTSNFGNFSLLDSSNATEKAETVSVATEKTDVVTKSVIDTLMDLDAADDEVTNRPIAKENVTDAETVTDFAGSVDALNKQSDKSFLLDQDFVTSSTTTRSPLAESHADTDNREPILTFHPQNATSASSKWPFISFSTAAASSDWQPYVEELEAFLEPYSKDNQQNHVHCDFERQVSAGETCRFDLVYLGPSCTKRNHFGYSIGKPCVILSPAKIADWVPAAYDNETTDIPDEVQRLMRIFNANFMFITCDGATDEDRKKIGPMAYLPPYQGFPSYFFPSQPTPNYLAPLMAIEFLNPANSTRIDVICKAWAANLNDQPYKSTLKFSLQVN